MVCMDPVQILVILIIVAVLTLQVYTIFFRTRDNRKEERDALLFQQMDKLRDTLDQRLDSSNQAMQDNLYKQHSQSLKR